MDADPPEFEGNDVFGCDDPSEFPDDDPLDEGDRIFFTRVAPEEEFIRASTTTSQRLAEAHAKHTAHDAKDGLPEHFYEFADVFSKTSFDVLPDRKPWDHAIELVAGAKPSACKVYPLALDEQKELDEFLRENLATGRIRPSKSPMASPVFFVKKKDGSLRLVQDYRALNGMTVKNRYPLPLISDLINQLKGARYFTKLDVRWGFNNVRIREGDEWKGAFRTNRGLFEPLVMFFGMTNSPGTFQNMMNDILHDLIMEGVVAVYLDDILIFTKTLAEHRRVVKAVLERLREYKLFLRADKCEFEKERIEYLGVIISHNHVEMDPVKVAGVRNWPVPETKKEVSSFLGSTNFYRRFIEGFSHVARPLFDLTCKDAKFRWTSEAQNAFDELKRRITSDPILLLADDKRPFRVAADASDVATGAVLEQQGEDGKWHPVAFYSKSLSAVERNYEIHDKEMLAIIHALEEWRHYLEGAEHLFEIWTDHKNLEYFRTARRLNRRQARWSLYLSRFDYTLHHRPGSTMGKPDALSRRADHHPGPADNDNMVLLTADHFVISALSALTIEGEEVTILGDVRSALEAEEELEEPVLRAVRELRKSGTKSVRSAEWHEDGGLLYFRGKLYVPPSRDLRRRILAQHHDSLVAGRDDLKRWNW